MTNSTVLETSSKFFYVALLPGKVKGKGHPITGHEDPEGEQMYSYTLPSTWALDAGWVVK